MGSSTLKWVIRHRAPVNLLIDLVAFQLALTLVYFIRFESGVFTMPLKPQAESIVIMSVLFAGFWAIIFALKGMYKNELSTSRYESFAEVTKCVFAGFILLFLVIQALPDLQEAESLMDIDPAKPLTPTRLILFIYILLVLFISASGRAMFRNFIRSCFRRGIGKYQTILIGFGKRGRRLFNELQDIPESGYDVIGVVRGKDSENLPEGINNFELDQLENFLDSPNGKSVEFILISLEPSNRKRVLNIIERMSRYPVRMMIIPDFYQILTGLARGQKLYGVPLIEVFPRLLDPFTALIKRIMDLMVSLLILVFGFPVLFIVGILVLLTSRGPIFYSQQRVGLNGREFRLYKFRSMVTDAEKSTGAVLASENDPRVTRFGRFIRNSHLDELPQAWNVLKGDMSVVGPRPERKVFVDEFSNIIPFYNRRHNIKPGLTSLGQIRFGYASNVQEMRERLHYDLYYLENISIGLDIKIILNTAWVMFTMKGQ
ncbi:sugar transferase [Calditrichota bacterium]